MDPIFRTTGADFLDREIDSFLAAAAVYFRRRLVVERDNLAEVGALKLHFPLAGLGHMGRPKRVDATGHCYHILNRANLRATIFEKDADYEAFEKILDEALERFKIELWLIRLKRTRVV